MLDAIVVMGEGAAGVIGRVDEDALHLAGKLPLQRLQRQQVIAENQPVVELVGAGDTVFRVIALRWVFQQDARLQLGPVLLADPGEFEFLFLCHTKDINVVQWP